MDIGRWNNQESSPGLSLQTPFLTVSNHSTSKYLQRPYICSAACLSALHGRNSVSLQSVSFCSNFLDKHQVFLARKHFSLINSLWLLKSLTVEKVLFYWEEKKVVCDLPLVSTECTSPSFPSPSLCFSLLFL